MRAARRGPRHMSLARGRPAVAAGRARRHGEAAGGGEGEGPAAQLDEAERAAALAERRAAAAEAQADALQGRLAAAEKRAEELSWQARRPAPCLLSVTVS